MIHERLVIVIILSVLLLLTVWKMWGVSKLSPLQRLLYASIGTPILSVTSCTLLMMALSAIWGGHTWTNLERHIHIVVFTLLGAGVGYALSEGNTLQIIGDLVVGAVILCAYAIIVGLFGKNPMDLLETMILPVMIAGPLVICSQWLRSNRVRRFDKEDFRKLLWGLLKSIVVGLIFWAPQIVFYLMFGG